MIFFVMVFVSYYGNKLDTSSIRCNVCHSPSNYYLLAKLLIKAQNALSSLQQKKALVRVFGQLPPNKVRVRIRVGEQFSSRAIIVEPLVRCDSYSPKILQFEFSFFFFFFYLSFYFYFISNFLNCNTDLNNLCKKFYF